MAQNSVFTWRDGSGWIVLSGGNKIAGVGGDIEALAITRSIAGKPVAYIWAASDIDTGDKELDTLVELGASAGYLVDILTEDDDSLDEQLSDAGLIVIGDGADVDRLRGGLVGAAINAIDIAYNEGAVILGVGAGATVLGSLLATPKPGMGWIENATIMTHFDEQQSIALNTVLVNHPTALGVGLAAGSALAFGGGGEVEVWGEREITIRLGKDAIHA